MSGYLPIFFSQDRNNLSQLARSIEKVVSRNLDYAGKSHHYFGAAKQRLRTDSKNRVAYAAENKKTTRIEKALRS